MTIDEFIAAHPEYGDEEQAALREVWPHTFMGQANELDTAVRAFGRGLLDAITPKRWRND